jgi:hypothetical protein
MIMVYDVGGTGRGLGEQLFISIGGILYLLPFYSIKKNKSFVAL